MRDCADLLLIGSGRRAPRRRARTSCGLADAVNSRNGSKWRRRPPPLESPSEKRPSRQRLNNQDASSMPDAWAARSGHLLPVIGQRGGPRPPPPLLRGPWPPPPVCPFRHADGNGLARTRLVVLDDDRIQSHAGRELPSLCQMTCYGDGVRKSPRTGRGFASDAPERKPVGLPTILV